MSNNDVHDDSVLVRLRAEEEKLLEKQKEKRNKILIGFFSIAIVAIGVVSYYKLTSAKRT